MVSNCNKYGKKCILPLKYRYSGYKRDVYKHMFTVFTQVGVNQLTDFLRTVTAASDLVDCTLVNCAMAITNFHSVFR